MSTRDIKQARDVLSRAFIKILKLPESTPVEFVDNMIVVNDEAIYTFQELMPQIIRWALSCGYKIIIEEDGIRTWCFGEPYVNMKQKNVWDDFVYNKVNFIPFSSHKLEISVAAIIVAIYKRVFQ